MKKDYVTGVNLGSMSEQNSDLEDNDNENV